MNCACMDVLVSLTTCVTLPLTLSNHQEVAVMPPKKISNHLYTSVVYKVSFVEGE